MVLLKYSSSRMTWIISEINHRDGRKTFSLPTLFSPPSFPSSSSAYISHIEKESLPLQAPPPPPPPSSNSKISPAILFIIVILAVIFFISGLLHLIVRFLVKQHSSSSSTQSNSRYPREISGSEALQRQLQQLFHLHDSGLDQAFIDALPVFLYKEIVGPKEPFDCAVCLCEFSDDDKLRLLPVCSHAFHINCIDTWLLSNSTCPLCRGTLFVPGLAIENPIFDFEDSRVDDGLSDDREDGFSLPSQKPMELEEGTIAEKRVFSVRLGKFRNVNVGGDVALTAGVVGDGVITKNVGTEEGESSSSSLDARRCYSMGSYQYVVGDLNLQVALNNAARDREEKGMRRRGLNGNSTIEDSIDGKRLCERSRGESFSVSKIWQWSNKKGKIPISSDAVSLDNGLPWMGRRGGEQA